MCLIVHQSAGDRFLIRRDLFRYLSQHPADHSPEGFLLGTHASTVIESCLILVRALHRLRGHDRSGGRVDRTVGQPEGKGAFYPGDVHLALSTAYRILDRLGLEELIGLACERGDVSDDDGLGAHQLPDHDRVGIAVP